MVIERRALDSFVAALPAKGGAEERTTSFLVHPFAEAAREKSGYRLGISRFAPQRLQAAQASLGSGGRFGGSFPLLGLNKRVRDEWEIVKRFRKNAGAGSL
jgi:hypothetical protein